MALEPPGAPRTCLPGTSGRTRFTPDTPPPSTLIQYSPFLYDITALVPPSPALSEAMNGRVSRFRGAM
ncbi:hypothetical protein DPEC_G00003510 [Dallia pectoralis]|uniref:Uncharacterized protein n=1 Tax=Dallia pectoralis TaxID=75939 RepID=A0ACC2HJS8_DALPE|nr:hypothetical protein DPEC_G00003510 [Dallia pectoralis]